MNIPSIEVTGPWERIFEPDLASELSRILQGYLPERRWFRSKARQLTSLTVADFLEIRCPDVTAYLVVLRVEYTRGEPERYVLVLASADGSNGHDFLPHPQTIIARLTQPDGSARVLYEAVGNPRVSSRLLDLITEKRSLTGRGSEVRGHATSAFRRLRGIGGLDPRLLDVEQTNSSIRFGDRLILKLYRRLDEGVTPDVEIGAYLTEEARYPHTPATAGYLELNASDTPTTTLALLQSYIPNEGDAWSYSLSSLERYFNRLPPSTPSARDLPSTSLRERRARVEGLPTIRSFDALARSIPTSIATLIGDYLDAARLIGQRTAELHLALAAASVSPAMTAEPFDDEHGESLCRDMQRRASLVFEQLRVALPRVPSSAQAEVQRALSLQATAVETLGALLSVGGAGQRIRIHGDYHLGQLLCAGEDFYVIDFEGEPARPLSERRLKRSALADVAGMLRSFQYAAFSALHRRATQRDIGSTSRLHQWARVWERWVGAVFLNRYFEIASKGSFLPDERGASEALLNVYLLDKAVYELGYELNHRPSWMHVPVQGLEDLLAPRQGG